MAKEFSLEEALGTKKQTANEFSLEEALGKKPERTYGEAATDIGAKFVSGLGSLIQQPGQLYGLATGAIKEKDFGTTGAQGIGQEMQEWAKEHTSKALLAKEAETARKAQEAEKTGGQWAAFKAQAGAMLSDPAQLTAFLAEQTPQAIPSIIAALIPGAGPGVAAELRAAQVAAKSATTVAAKEAAEAAVASAVQKATASQVARGAAAAKGVGAVQQGADIGAGAYEDIYKKLIEGGASEPEAADKAINLARAAGVGGGALSLLAAKLPGAQAFERALAGEKIGAKGILGKAAAIGAGALKEIPGEQFEEVGGKALQNLAMRQVNPEQSLTEGLGITAAQAAIGAAGMGGVGGALSGRQPEAGPKTLPPATEEKRLALGMDKPFMPTPLPDGSVAMTREDLARYEEEQFQKKYAPQEAEKPYTPSPSLTGMDMAERLAQRPGGGGLADIVAARRTGAEDARVEEARRARVAPESVEAGRNVLRTDRGNEDLMAVMSERRAVEDAAAQKEAQRLARVESQQAKKQAALLGEVESPMMTGIRERKAAQEAADAAAEKQRQRDAQKAEEAKYAVNPSVTKTPMPGMLGGTPAGGDLATMMRTKREEQEAKAEIPLDDDYAFLQREKQRLMAEEKSPQSKLMLERIDERMGEILKRDIENMRKDKEKAATSVFGEENLPPVEERGVVVGNKELSELQAPTLPSDEKVTGKEARQLRQFEKQRTEPAPVDDAQARLEQAEMERRKFLRSQDAKDGNLMKLLEGKLSLDEVSDIAPKGKGFEKLANKNGTYISEMISDGLLDNFLPPDERVGMTNFDAQKSAETIKEKLRNKDTQTFDRSIALRQLDDQIASLEQEAKQPSKTEFDVSEVTPGEAASIDRSLGDVRFKRSTGTASIGKQAVQSIVDAIKARWKNSPEVVVAENMDDPIIPQEVRDHNAKQVKGGAKGSPQGFFYKGKAYVIADKIGSVKEAVEALMHEALGHYGLRGVFGSKMEAVLKDVIKHRRTEVEGKAEQYGLDTKNNEDLLEAAEEVLAVMAQTKPGLPFVKRAMAIIRNFLRDLGFNIKMSDADIIQKYILPARAFVESGKGRTTEGKPAASREVDIPKFSEDIPNESWLQEKINYAQRSPRNEFGVPKMSSVTGRFKEPVMIPARWLKDAKGQRGEEKNVRQKDLDAIRKIIRGTGKFPLNEDGTEYVPYIEIGYDGKPWVSEGNHRIMAAIAEGMDYIPVELRYFDGGQRRAGVWGPGNVASITERVEQEKPLASRKEGAKTSPITEAFKRWFGDSKAVDADGDPMVMYHSTFSDVASPKTNFRGDEYRRFGFHVGSLEAAESRLDVKSAEDHANKERSGDAGANVMPVYISVKNPLRLDENRSGRWGVDDIMDAIMKKAERGEIEGISNDAIDAYFDDNFLIEQEVGLDAEIGSDNEPRAWQDQTEWAPGERSDLLKAFLQQLGYDGIVYANEFEGGGDSYIVLDPRQVKSATGNIGTYDAKNADVRFKRSEKPTPSQAGKEALAVLESTGMQLPPAEPGRVERVKAAAKSAAENPAMTIASAKQATSKFLDKMEVAAFSGDAAFNNDVRRNLIADFDENSEVLGMLLEASQSQAVHSDALASQFIIDGGIAYDEEAKKWVSIKKEDNFIALAQKIDKLAEKYGLNKEQAERVAHTYFVAKRFKSLLSKQRSRDSEIDRLEGELEAENANIKKYRKENDYEKVRTSERAKNDIKAEIKKLKEAEVFITPDQIALIEPGMSLAKSMPELTDISDTWQGIRANAVKAMIDGGLWSREQAENMLDNIDYVPFYREEQLEEGGGPQEFVKGLQIKAKEYRLKGSGSPVNDVFDNMVRWSQYAINRSVRNHKALQMVDIGTELQVGDRKMAEKTDKMDPKKNTIRVFRDGTQEIYSMADPLYVDAFSAISNVTIPSLKFFTWFSNLLRQSVVLYPLFSVAQVPQDAISAMFSSGLKTKYALRIPVLAVKEFIKTLNKTSATHNLLKTYGATGVRDFSAAIARKDVEIAAGLKAQKSLGGRVLEGLSHIAMAADNSVRQAVYDASMAQGLSKAEAIEKAFDIINFRRRGTSKMINLAGQTVPFFYAYMSVQRTAYKTLTGVGISPQKRSEALKTLATTSGAMMAMALFYTMMNADDEEYKKTPEAIRDRTLNIPGTGGLRIPLRPDLFLMPKVMTEHLYHLITDNGLSDSAKFRKSVSDGIANAVLSPQPIPQALKPAIEVGINYDFFQGRPLIGQFEKQKEAERQFNDNTSEFSKVLGQFGVSPIAADHVIRGMFGSAGGLFLYTTNFMINSDPDVPRPELSFRDAMAALPGTSGFVTKASENALKGDFYALRDEVEKTKNTYNDIKTRSPQELEQFLSDEKNIARLGLAKGTEKIGMQLSKIRRAIAQITNAPEDLYSASEKKDAIKELRQVEKEILQSINLPELRKQAMI
jgi:hypothetical protein